jgi:pyridoxal phosphate-dependent aminotransferase EpsN
MPRIWLSPPHPTGRELELVADAIASNWLAPLGPHVDAFEREFCEAVAVEHGVALSSGTAALHLALLVLGIGPGDEVACASLTFSATANAIVYTGARPFFVDCDHTWTIDPALLDEAIVVRRAAGARVRAVVAVDLYGQCCDYEALQAVCARHDVHLIQDAAEALAAFSFNGNKIITTSGGGMLVGADRDLVEHARKLSTQAREPAPHYEHVELGFNYRLSNVLAALGRAQLAALPERVAAKRRITATYRALLEDVPGLTFMPVAPWGEGNCWLTTIVVDPARFGADREDVRLALAEADIEARPVWKPMHLQPVFAAYPAFDGEVATRLFADGLCLPSGSALTDGELEEIAELVRGVARG